MTHFVIYRWPMLVISLEFESISLFIVFVIADDMAKTQTVYMMVYAGV